MVDVALGRSVSGLTIVTGTAASAFALLDPATLPYAAVVASVALVLGTAFSGRRLAATRTTVALLGAVCLIAALVQPELQRADAVSYFAYLRSTFFDGDLDFTNEWARWGYEPPPLTSTGLRTNVHSVGPALLWSPFFCLGHAYLLAMHALGGTAYSLDGYSLPYWRSAVLGTVVVVWGGASLLVSAMASRFGGFHSLVAMAATVGATFILYYLFIVPVMSHGVVFGVGCAALWAWFRADREPSTRNWLILGALSGMLVLVRWQALIFLFLPALLGAVQIWRRQVRPTRIALAALLAALVFAPQMLVWKVLYGRFVVLPQGEAFIDWRSPHFVDVLLSADHGLFTWTPIAFIGLIGLLFLRRSEPIFVCGALAVWLGSAWLCGGVRDWAASDAFGARRFDYVMALAAVGVAAFAARARTLIALRPGWVLVALAAVFVAWNIGFVRLFEGNAFTGAAPLERLASGQARALRQLATDVLGAIAGQRGRSLVYKATVGEYFYDNINPSGAIIVGAVDSPYLLDGWSRIRVREGWPQFRWALSPLACARVPLGRPFDLRVTVTARSVPGVQAQPVEFLVNGERVANAILEPSWKDAAFVVPKNYLVSGENRLCLSFPRAAAKGPEPGAAAAVTLIQLP